MKNDELFNWIQSGEGHRDKAQEDEFAKERLKELKGERKGV